MANKCFKAKVLASKKKFYDNKIKNSSNVIKDTWKIINKEVGSKNKTHKNFKIKNKGKLCANPGTICQLFLDYFIKNGTENAENLNSNDETEEDLSNSDTEEDLSNNNVFVLKTIDSKTLNKIICKLKSKYSAGYDEVPIAIVKRAKDILIKPLLHVVNASIITGTFPEKLKVSKIIPIHKKDNKDDITNYRPVALLPAFSKMFERTILEQLLDYLEKNKILDSFQHGFRKGKSVVTAAIEFIEAMIDAIDNSEKAVGIFLDLCKAFESISHKILLKRLYNLGVKDRALHWFKSYLINRKQFVQITHLNKNNFKSTHNSTIKTTNIGVPQGSILGPLLFICYLKGVPQLEGNSKIVFFADDANMKISADNEYEVEDIAQVNISSLNSFFTENNLCVNANKTNLITFTTQQRKPFKPKIKINDQIISQTKSTKFLGLIIDETLNWSEHVSMILSKTSSGLYALRKMSFFSNLETLRTIYFAYIHSVISFGISLYGATTIKNMDSILKVQKQAIRIMLHLEQYDSVKEHFANLGIMTVYSLYIYHIIIHVKERFGDLPKLGESHQYPTRNKDKLCLVNHRLQYYCKKPSYMGSKCYNNLPTEILQQTNINKFKAKLKLYLMGGAYYSVEELFNTV